MRDFPLINDDYDSHKGNLVTWVSSEKPAPHFARMIRFKKQGELLVSQSFSKLTKFSSGNSRNIFVENQKLSSGNSQKAPITSSLTTSNGNSRKSSPTIPTLRQLTTRDEKSRTLSKIISIYKRLCNLGRKTSHTNNKHEFVMLNEDLRFYCWSNMGYIKDSPIVEYVQLKN